MKLLFLLSFLVPVLGFSSENVEVHTHSYPVTDTAFETEWTLVGSHHFKYRIFFSVLTGALYEQKNGDGERLVFTYTRDIKANDLVSSSSKHLQETRPEEELTRYADLLEQIQGAYTDLKENDSYAITVLPERGVWLERDGEVVFQSENAEFGDWYLDIWLGDPPISEEMKNGLLED